jgi:hypothetical protein
MVKLFTFVGVTLILWALLRSIYIVIISLWSVCYHYRPFRFIWNIPCDGIYLKEQELRLH